MPNKRKQSRYWTNLRAAEVKIIQYYLDCTDTVPEAAAMMQMDPAWVYKKMRDLGIPSPRAAKAADKEPVTEETPEVVTDTAPEVLNDTGPNGTDEDDHGGGVVIFPTRGDPDEDSLDTED